MASERVKVGVIGAGFIGHLHAEALARVPNAEVVAIASPTPERGRALADQFGIPRHSTDYREMLQLDDLDMVTVGAPNDLHARICIDAARAGKHVVCEKPLCLTLEDADAVIAAEDGRAVLEVIYAAYLSAGTGNAVDLPLGEVSVQQPIALCLGAEDDA